MQPGRIASHLEGTGFSRDIVTTDLFRVLAEYHAMRSDK